MLGLVHGYARMPFQPHARPTPKADEPEADEESKVERDAEGARVLARDAREESFRLLDGLVRAHGGIAKAPVHEVAILAALAAARGRLLQAVRALRAAQARREQAPEAVDLAAVQLALALATAEVAEPVRGVLDELVAEAAVGATLAWAEARVEAWRATGGAACAEAMAHVARAGGRVAWSDVAAVLVAAPMPSVEATRALLHHAEGVLLMSEQPELLRTTLAQMRAKAAEAFPRGQWEASE